MYRVFLIDDEPWAMVTLELLIDWQSLGFEIAGKVDNARAAWEQILQQQPDVIVTDIRMPGLSGLELLSRIHGAALPVEVVLVSAFADFAYAQEAIGKGAFAYLLKPVRSDRLTACFRQLRDRLDMRRAQRGQEERKRRQALLTRSATAGEAFAALGGRGGGEIVLLHGGAALEALLAGEAADVMPRVTLDDGEIVALTPWAEGLPERLSALCRERAETGVFGLARGDTRLDTLAYLARNAWLSARFAGAAGFAAGLDSPGYAGEVDLFMALQYNRRGMVLSHLEALRREVEAGRMLVDKLFTLLMSVDSFWRHARETASLFPSEWKQYADLLRDYPDCASLFDHLTAVFSDDAEEALLSPVMEEIRERYACNRTVADLAQELGVSQAHLSQLIRRRTGRTYSELVQEMRMDRAKELLAYSGKAVMDIALEVGYSDQFYFSKLFKRLWGMSPNAWRKQARSGNKITKSEME
ncbi:MAG: helix-turn-helix domain-containing protein [Aristaeellaceae bacterium]